MKYRNTKLILLFFFQMLIFCRLGIPNLDQWYYSDPITAILTLLSQLFSDHQINY